MLTITHVCRVAWPSVGGMETMVGELAARQARAGHRVKVVTLTPGASEGPGGVRYERLASLGPARWQGARGLAAAVGASGVVHQHGVDGLLDQLIWRCRLGNRVGVSTHGAYFHTRRNPWLKALAAATVTRATLSRAAAVWFTSRTDRSLLRASGGTVIPNGVDAERWAGVVRSPQPGRWLVWGRIDEHKGLGDLLETLARLPASSGFRELVVVGPEARPGLVAGLIARAAALGLRDRVHFLGAVDDTRLFGELGRCERALFPSRHEGFGLTVVEAMAARVPVVVSSIAPFREKVVHGTHGAVVDFQRPELAASALGAWCQRPASSTVQAAFVASTGWTWEAVAPRFARAYKAIEEGR